MPQKQHFFVLFAVISVLLRLYFPCLIIAVFSHFDLNIILGRCVIVLKYAQDGVSES